MEMFQQQFRKWNIEEAMYGAPMAWESIVCLQSFRTVFVKCGFGAQCSQHFRHLRKQQVGEIASHVDCSSTFLSVVVNKS